MGMVRNASGACSPSSSHSGVPSRHENIGLALPRSRIAPTSPPVAPTSPPKAREHRASLPSASWMLHPTPHACLGGTGCFGPPGLLSVHLDRVDRRVFPIET